MSNVCYREFKGWVRSFTKTERVLAILEAVLLVSFIILLVLLILHLLACSQSDTDHPHTTSTAAHHPTEHPTRHNTSATHSGGINRGIIGIVIKKADVGLFSLNTTGKVCSWTPSAKTAAVTHHYEDGITPHTAATESPAEHTTETGSHNYTAFDGNTSGVEDVTAAEQEYADEYAFSERSEDEDADDEYEPCVRALVKMDSPNDVTFGCILTVVSRRWALTAASCVEAIEEVDSLDSFVIVERYGGGDGGPPRSVLDVQIHPLYEGRNRSYDLAAVRVSGGPAPRAVELATALDSLLSAAGDSFTVLGYAPLGSLRGGRVRAARVRRVAAAACGERGQGEGRGWALRHLGAGQAAPAARCSAAALCAGPVPARGAACGMCAGAPLLRGRALHGVMADNPRCGLSCEPALYVDVADLAGWIRSVVRRD